MAEPLLSRLDDLLAAEREALLTADYERLPELAPRKAQLVDRLVRTRLPAADLRRADEKLRRNQAILAAAVSGLRDAAARAEIRREVAGALTTYDRTGSVSRIGTGRGGIERKA